MRLQSSSDAARNFRVRRRSTSGSRCDCPRTLIKESCRRVSFQRSNNSPLKLQRSLVDCTRPGNVCQHSSYYSGRRGKLVYITWTFVAQVYHTSAERCEDIRDDTAVTSPPEHLSAHDDRTQPGGEHEQFVKSFSEFLSRDVIGVRLKGRMSPRAVARAFHGTSAPAERGNPAIENSCSGEVGGERVAREVRQASRARKTSDVDHELDLVHLEQMEKLLARVRGMADRPNGELRQRLLCAKNFAYRRPCSVSALSTAAGATRSVSGPATR